MQRQRLRPPITAAELAFVVISVACLATAGIVYGRPHPSTTAAVTTLLLVLVAVGCLLANVASIVRRARAQAGRPDS